MADYLKLTSKQNGSKVKLTLIGAVYGRLATRINGQGDWVNYAFGTEYTLNSNEYVEFKNINNLDVSEDTNNYVQFVMSGKFEADGDITTLCATDGTDAPLTYAFNYLFKFCDALVKAPDCSRITTASSYLFRFTFAGTSITELPKFNENIDVTGSTTRGMFWATFNECNKLKKVRLPFKKPLNNSYAFQYMFYDSKNLEEFDFGDQIPTSNRVSYQYMFQGCSKLKKITVKWTNWYTGSSGSSMTAHWLDDVSEKGEFHCPTELEALIPSRDGSGIPSTWELNPVPETGMRLKINDKKIGSLYLNGKAVQLLYINGKLNYSAGITGAIAFTSRQDDSTIKIAHYGLNLGTPPNLEYKVDGDWMPYTLGTQLNIAKGWTIYFRNTTGTFSYDDSSWYSVVAKGGWDVAGELNALLDYRVKADTVPQYAFNQLFYDDETFTSSDIVDASKLKIQFKTIGMYAMSAMFGGCEKLEKAPKKIDANVVQQAGCLSMFYNCGLLQTAPELPAMDIGAQGYQGMFDGSGLTVAPKLPAMTIDSRSYMSMFARTKIVQPPALPATTLAPYCYNGMFQNCTTLIAAPTLPAMMLASNCYNSMFRGCTSVTKCPELPATTLATSCYQGMFQQSGVTAVPRMDAETLVQSCYQSMFEGCNGITGLNPFMYPTTLATSCCYRMFANCKNLEFINSNGVLDATTLATACYREMFLGCTSLRATSLIYFTLPATTLVAQCYQGMFNGCTSLGYIRVKFTEWPTAILATATQNWLNNVASTGTFVCPTALIDPSSRGGNTIPSGWTIQRK